MVETLNLLLQPFTSLWPNLTRFYAIQIYTVVFQTRCCRSVKQNRDQEGKENKVTNGNTLCRAKVMSEHVENAKDKNFVSVY